MLITWLFLLVHVNYGLFQSSNDTVYYDSFYGKPISLEELKRREKLNTTFWCVTPLKPCNPNEFRRLDGSCNNLQHPSRGAAKTPFVRLLPATYAKGFDPRLSKGGEPLPLARYVRTTLMAEGQVPDQKFTHLLANYFVFASSDTAVVHDTINYVLWKPYCCQPKGKTDPMCVPNEIPKDDPVHRFSGHRCLNMTRPMSFQTNGCLKNDTVPERINAATPLFDMSSVYGSDPKDTLAKGRLFKGGLLKFEEENGRIWPPSTKTAFNLCLLNQKPSETRCHDSPDSGLNSLLGINLVGIWFWRNHNRIANELAKLNPCWDDELLFYTARDINIATYQQIFYYEMLPSFMGYENLLRDGVIGVSPLFRDLYQENVAPQLSLEYLSALRWVHTVQEGTLKLYKNDGKVVGEFPIANLTLRTGFLAKDNNIDYLTQGSFRQAGAKADYIVDPEMSENGLGGHQSTTDLLTSDLAKNRYFGFLPYVNYLEYCRGRKYTRFEDLLDLIAPERIELLKKVYRDVEDIDMHAGIWMENLIQGGHVPPTMYCITVDQLIRSMVSDRHWYERQDRPHAFSLGQLLEIRKATIAGLLCDVGDTVTEIQPNAFERIGPSNELQSCRHIRKINLNAWKDERCSGKPNVLYWYQHFKKNGLMRRSASRETHQYFPAPGQTFGWNYNPLHL